MLEFSRFVATGPDGVAVLAQGVGRSFETDLMGLIMVEGGALADEQSQQVVSNGEHAQFLMDHGGAFAAQLFHAHGGFDVAQEQFGMPPAPIELGDVFFGIELRVG